MCCGYELCCSMAPLREVLPLDGGGLGGGDVFRRARRDMTKDPIDGAAARARTLRQNMAEAERWVCQILRLDQLKGVQVPPPTADRPLYCRLCGPTTCARRARLIVEIDGGQYDCLSPREGRVKRGSCAVKAIAFCGFGTTRCWKISTASIRRSLMNSAISPPPKPSPIEGEDFCQVRAQDLNPFSPMNKLRSNTARGRR